MFIGYSDWKEKQIAAMADDDIVECPACNGAGEQECECCGSERVCGRCDGEGKARWGDLVESERARLFTTERFRRILLDEAIAYGEWTQSDPIELLMKDGFAPWQDLARKEIQINIT